MVFFFYKWPKILIHNTRNFLSLVLRSPHSSDLKAHLGAIPSLSSLAVLLSCLENMCLFKQWWPLHVQAIFHIPVGLISSLTCSPSGPHSSSKALTGSCILCSLGCQCLEGAVAPPKGQWWSQAALEAAAEAWKQAESQDSLLSSLMCFLKRVWLTQTSFSCFLLLKSWCDPLVWSAQSSRQPGESHEGAHSQELHALPRCVYT